MPKTSSQAIFDNQDYASVARLIEKHNQATPDARDLRTLASDIGMSELQVQRLFSRWAGISPKRFAQYLTVQDIRERLQSQASLLDLSLDAGLSSTSIVHDHFVHFYAMSPKQVRELGNGIVIRHGFYASPFGQCHIASTDKGICWLAFTDPISRINAIEQLESEWPNAEIVPDEDQHLEIINSIFTAAENKKPLYLHIKGTNFQLRVWEALLKIPAGYYSRYQDIARTIDAPGAARAVGSAIGRNPISWLIPCHRVIRASGVVGHYRWGQTRKQSLLAWEQCTYPRK
jgi:AraC family transcriptional regulator of adaptative response/methylated-DNA-[protein]-cysteine methyltransferase